uniref:diphthine methyl ester synthase n=1 Tax=Amphiprion percula TaxID=161767 RepID=A0A3P8TSH2_AMPPE
MLYLIGLGLGDAADITVKGLQAVKSCSRVYLEAYTSILTVGKEALEEYYGKELILADRDLVEQGADEILKDADVTDVAFLVVGDPFGATTHSDLVLRAVNAGIPYKVIHNASIMNAVGCCGLQLYNFGETVSVVFWTETWKPESFYDKICKNKAAGLHTLCLLDIKVKEQTIENMMRGKKIYEPPRYMTVSQAADQLIQIIDRRRKEGEELGESHLIYFHLIGSVGSLSVQQFSFRGLSRNTLRYVLTFTIFRGLRCNILRRKLLGCNLQGKIVFQYRKWLNRLEKYNSLSIKS